MNQDTQTEITKLKRSILESERVYDAEKRCLLQIINTFGSVMAVQTEFSAEVKSIKLLANAGEALPMVSIDQEIGELKTKIYSEEAKKDAVGDDPGTGESAKIRKSDLYAIVRGILDLLTGDFYPVSGELEKKSKALRSYYHGDMTENEMQEMASLLMVYIGNLKGKIGRDFGYVNDTFLTLLEHVKELEGTLLQEFTGKGRQKEMDQFEANIHDKVGSIVGSFDVHKTIEDVRAAVIGKLSQIKAAISQRKKDERARAQRARKRIHKLKTRIAGAEKDAREMAQKAQHFEVAATKDKLTGVYNRAAFDSKMSAVIKESGKGDEPFSLGLLDIDDFKLINDTHGHVSGDVVLKMVAQCLRETFRKSDFVARYGGDEFAIVIEGLSIDMVRDRIQKFNDSFKKKRFRSRETGDVEITVSIGIAQHRKEESAEDMIDRADKEMYQSKKKKSSLKQ